LIVAEGNFHELVAEFSFIINVDAIVIINQLHEMILDETAERWSVTWIELQALFNQSCNPRIAIGWNLWRFFAAD